VFTFYLHHWLRTNNILGVQILLYHLCRTSSLFISIGQHTIDYNQLLPPFQNQNILYFETEGVDSKIMGITTTAQVLAVAVINAKSHTYTL
jgi:hypothetical protein